MIIKEALKFIESDEMREHLQNPEVDVEILQWAMLIAQSRAALADKASALKTIAENYNKEVVDNTDKIINVSDMAEKAFWALIETKYIPPGSVFILTQYWIDDEVIWVNDGKKFFGDYHKKKSQPFTTFEKAVNYIHEKNNSFCRNGEEISDDTSSWYEVARWDRDENGLLNVEIKWLLGYSGIIWGYSDVDNMWLYGDDFFSIGYGKGINLPTPFKAGDTVTVDMRPFTESFHAAILWTDDKNNTTNLSPVCLFINRAGNVEVGALNHLSSHLPCFSPLLRAKRYDGKLFGREIPLKFISECVKKDYELGAKIKDITSNNIKDGSQRVSWFEIKNLLTDKLKVELEKVRLQADLDTTFGPFETVEAMNEHLDAIEDLLEDE